MTGASTDRRDDASDGDGREHLCVSGVPLFQGLTVDQQHQVAAMARPTKLTKGQRVHAADSYRTDLLVVHRGSLKISRIDADGHEQILRVLGPGGFIGESAFLTGRRPRHFATALEPGSMCVFRHADLNALVRAHPSIGFRMLQAVSRRLDDTESRLAALISGDVTSRLAGYLLSLPGRHIDGRLEVELPMAKKDVASLLDTTPESLSRQLRRLQESGVIATSAGRVIRIMDVDALLEISVEH